ncbi:MAG TPA: cupin domain-containing protein [Solirubrobacteraceae bacterium]|nr:cupin domain-containing protein [Solirubrobacteraceae bacterium]
MGSREGAATVGPETGFDALAQAVLTLEPGERCARDSGEAEETVFVVAGQGELEAAGERHSLEPESGAYVPPGTRYELAASGSEALRAICVRVPDPASEAAGGRVTVRRLAEQEAQAATTEREFRIVCDPDSGLCSATHFVGYIPTARAPEHFHTYDEVIYVLDGEGVFHAGDYHERLAPGSCIQLPARTVHCLENTGPGTMRVVAVFRPAGSPAAAYYPDGTPAHPGIPPVTTDVAP